MDARVRYTKKVIRDCFLELLRDKELDKITVTELCSNAQINRATFYKYYDNPHDLLKKLEQEQLDHLAQRVRVEAKKRPFSYLHVILSDILDNRDLYLMIFEKSGDDSFRRQILDVCYEENMEVIRETFPALSPARQEWLYYFVAEGCNGILQRWLEDGEKQPAEEMLDFLDWTIRSINSYLPEA